MGVFDTTQHVRAVAAQDSVTLKITREDGVRRDFQFDKDKDCQQDHSNNQGGNGIHRSR